LAESAIARNRSHALLEGVKPQLVAPPLPPYWAHQGAACASPVDRIATAKAMIASVGMETSSHPDAWQLSSCGSGPKGPDLVRP
jgi:hypothetical protein